MPTFGRRKFIKATGVTALPTLIPFLPALGNKATQYDQPDITRPIRFFGDAEMPEPGEYLAELQKLNGLTPIVKDRYGSGGAVEQLEKKFAQITGKEAAIFMPSGTMANEFAISVLSEGKSKVFVQDTSHVYRDEADAAQSIFHKRLMPLARNETFFTIQQLRDAIDSLASEEVFKSGVGAVSIENPVRRANGRMVPLDEIKKISAYCRSQNIRLHLDGARLFIASAWSGIPIREYSTYFDTVYISLYKYLGASAGAILCGAQNVIGQMPHLMKVHGGSMFGNWTNAAMALHRLDGIEARFASVIKRSQELIASLNKINGVKITTLDGGTNIYQLEVSRGTDGKKFQESLNLKHNIRIGALNNKNITMLTMNETLLYESVDYVVNAFQKALES